MAEERILIRKEINCNPPCGGWRGDGKEIIITRQEAIEKMAKAIFLQIYPVEETDIVNSCSDYKNMAEAALNALLED